MPFEEADDTGEADEGRRACHAFFIGAGAGRCDDSTSTDIAGDTEGTAGNGRGGKTAAEETACLKQFDTGAFGRFNVLEPLRALYYVWFVTMNHMMSNTNVISSPLGNIICVATPLGNITSVATPLGNITSVATPHGNITSVATPLGNITSVATPLGNITSVATPHGNITSVATPLGNITSVATPGTITSVATPHGTITSVATPHGTITSVATPHDNVTSVATPYGNVTNDGVDPAGVKPTAPRTGLADYITRRTQMLNIAEMEVWEFEDV
ncbi:mucin-22-like [Procambarus clarkii]|uniref:mucin-22-like n=1 Tax=Procambarus clarkii TaxID=6728 RepID=UPI0037429551